MSRIQFDPNERFLVAVVNNKPYLYYDLRIERSTVPEGLILYECADDGTSGRICRVQNGVMVNFWGSLIGKEPLPMEDGTYYPKMDTRYDEERDAFLETLDDEEYDSKMEEYDDEHYPDDEVYYISGDCSLDEYLRRYDELMADIVKYETLPETDVERSGK